MKPKCAVCGRRINPRDGKSELLWLKPDGTEVWVHLGQCMDRFNDQD